MENLVEFITKQEAFQNAISEGIAVTIRKDDHGNVNVIFTGKIFETLRIFSDDAISNGYGRAAVSLELEAMYKNVSNAMKGIISND